MGKLLSMPACSATRCMALRGQEPGTSYTYSPVNIQTSAQSDPCPPSLYVKILLDPLKQGPSRVEPAHESCWGKAPAFTRLDR
jgi:hypothetical protein